MLEKIEFKKLYVNKIYVVMISEKVEFLSFLNKEGTYKKHDLSWQYISIHGQNLTIYGGKWNNTDN